MEIDVLRKEEMESTYEDGSRSEQKGGKLPSVARVAYNTLLENTFGSNLVADISKVDYTKGNVGKTDIAPLGELRDFVDDVDVFGYCRAEQMGCVGRRIYYKKTTRETRDGKKQVESEASSVCASIAAAFLGAGFDKERAKCPRILCTTRKDAKGKVCDTIRAIERATKGRTRKRWLQTNNIREPYTEKLEDQNAIVGVFVAKVDLSEYTMAEVEKYLPRLHVLLEGAAFGIFSIDYTQDFSGTMVPEELEKHFLSIGCRMEGNLEQVDENVGTILSNSNSVGKHVCTRLHTYKGLLVRQKIYNKIVCQFEAGCVQDMFGGHLADYVACPNKHLRKTFENPDAKERGISRIEISVYGCCTKNPLQYAKELQKQTISQMHGKQLFCVQSVASHWKNLSEAIDRCCLFVDYLRREIYVCWYGHTKTKRLSGVVVPIGKKDIEKVAMACVGEFGFHSCPIFRIDFAGRNKVDGKEVDSFFPLQCYTRPVGSKTVLCPSKHPTKRYDNEQDPSIVLSPSTHIHWKWKKGGTRIGMGKTPTDMDKIPTKRKISNIGWKRKEAEFDLLEEERQERLWKEGNVPRVDALVAERKQEIQRIVELQEEKKEKILLLEKYSEYIRLALGCKTRKVHEIEDLPQKYLVLGYKQTHGTLYGSGKIYVLCHKDPNETSNFFPVWATKRLDTILGNQYSIPETNKTKDVRVYVDFVANGEIEIEIREKKSFCTREGTDRFYCPIDVVRIPKVLDISLVDGEVEKMYKAMEPTKEQQLCHRPTLPKERKTKLADIAEGEYVCFEYSTFQSRGRTRYVLFLGEEGKSVVGFG